MNIYKFSAASEREHIVFGAARPGYRQVDEWIAFMQHQGIQRVCCLLSPAQLDRYSDLLGNYQQAFGLSKTCWAPIEDFSFVDFETFAQQILPFLVTADQQQAPVVVHCSGGVGRTGHVLAAWLVAGRGFSREMAIAAVKRTGRNPYEAAIAAPLKGQNPWKAAAKLNTLLDQCAALRESQR
jgi:protein-tyrosine phosphatase